MAGTRTLQVRHVRLDVTVAAGTAQATPQSTPWPLGRVVVDQIDLRIPPGPSGLAGIAILYAGVPILPSEQPNTFFTGDDEHMSLPVGWEISGPFTILTYNTDIYPHKFLLRAQIRDMVLVTAGAVTAGQVVVSALPNTPGPSDADLEAAIAIPAAGEPEQVEPASVGDLGVIGE